MLLVAGSSSVFLLLSVPGPAFLASGFFCLVPVLWLPEATVF